MPRLNFHQTIDEQFALVERHKNDFDALYKLYNELFEHYVELDLFLDLMIERFGEKLDDESTKEYKAFEISKKDYLAVEKVLKHVEYCLKAKHADRIAGTPKVVQRQ